MSASGPSGPLVENVKLPVECGNIVFQCINARQRGVFNALILVRSLGRC